MASFIIHTIAGEKFLNKLEESYNISLSDYNRKQFLLGNLIVDSTKTDKTIPDNLSQEELTAHQFAIKRRIIEEKLLTHFRDPSKEGECIKTPVPDNFLEKYCHLLDKNFSVLGYLFHLFTDKMFFKDLFIASFENLGPAGTPVTLDKDVVYIRIKKNNQIVDAKEFWAKTHKTNIYHDYTVMNRILLERFGTSFDAPELIEFAQSSFQNPGIEEVSFSKIASIIRKTQKYIEESYQTESSELTVFTEAQIIAFISDVVEQFVIEYKGILDALEKNKTKSKVIT